MDYLTRYYLNEAMDYGWSDVMRFRITEKHQINVGLIPTTNNHLESFNRVFKAYRLQNIAPGVQLPRIDVLLSGLIKEITPNIYLRLKDPARRKSPQQDRSFISVYADRNDTRRFETGYALALTRDHVQVLSDTDLIRFKVCSALNDNLDYTVLISTPYSSNHVFFCECVDLKSNGGYCKHLWAATIFYNQKVLSQDFLCTPPSKDSPLILPVEFNVDTPCVSTRLEEGDCSREDGFSGDQDYEIRLGEDFAQDQLLLGLVDRITAMKAECNDLCQLARAIKPGKRRWLEELVKRIEEDFGEAQMKLNGYRSLFEEEGVVEKIPDVLPKFKRSRKSNEI